MIPFNIYTKLEIIVKSTEPITDLGSNNKGFIVVIISGINTDGV